LGPAIEYKSSPVAPVSIWEQEMINTWVELALPTPLAVILGMHPLELPVGVQYDE
jgi:hypothetical protein